MTEHITDEREYPRPDDGSTGVEIEDISSGEPIREPFDPTQIRVYPRPMTVDLLLKRIDRNGLILSPGFQRRAGIWNEETQSRLIESLLIRIPISAFYIDGTDEDEWLVVDGLQRLTTLKRFVLDRDLKLSGLEYLAEFEGRTYDDLELRFQRRIRETQVYVYMIEKGTPPDVKFNIFKRINTGGLPLSAQEIRHALNQGKAPEFLRQLAESKPFLHATAHGISDKRMAAQECVLRFVAFTLTPYTNYRKGDLDNFLNETMGRMNEMSGGELAELERQFVQAMELAREIFDDDAFRKRYDKEHRRYPINKALFEAWAVNLGKLSQEHVSALVQNREALKDKFIELMNTSDFNSAVSQGTGSPKRVRIRFEEIERIIQEVLV